MGEYLLIDGYNVINAWKEFAQLRQTSLEHAREILVAGVSEYAAFKGYKAIVVFDALEVAGAVAIETIHGIQVFTQGRARPPTPGLNAGPTSWVTDPISPRFLW